MAQEIDLLKNSSFEGKMDLLIEAIIRGENYDYAQLLNKPSINNYTLDGNKTSAQLGLLSSGDIVDETENIDFSNYFN